MKKSAIITLIICLIVFVMSATAGTLLTIRTVGWSDLSDSSQLGPRLEGLFRQVSWFEFSFGPSQRFSIDQEHVLPTDGIHEIQVTSLAEDVVVHTGGPDIKARLSGNYRSRGSEIVWQSELQDGILRIQAKYPRFGLSLSDLQMDLQIPAEFAGIVKINTLSGDCRLPDQADYQWSLFDFDTLSGDLSVARTNMAEVRFKSLSGRLRFEQADAALSGETMSGDLIIEMQNVKPLTAKTLSGDVRLIVPADAACDIHFTTLSGSFQPQDLAVQYTRQENRHVIASLNQGGTRIEVDTMSGDFQLQAP